MPRSRSIFAGLLGLALACGSAIAQGLATLTVIVEDIALGATVTVDGRLVTIARLTDGVFYIYTADQPVDPRHSAQALAALAPAAGPGARPMSGRFEPGRAFTVTARPGDRLVLAAGLEGESGLALATVEGGVPLIDARGRPATGVATARLAVYDRTSGRPLGGGEALAPAVRLSIH